MFAIKASEAGTIVLDGSGKPLELKPGEDFTVTEDNKIDWTIGIPNGRAPNPGEYYSMQYYMHPVYVVRSMPYQYRDITFKLKSPNLDLMNLPTKVQAWLEFLGGPGGD